MEARAWVIHLEEIFQVIDCNEEHKVTLATFMLRGEAKHWWWAVKETLPLEEDEPPTWETFLNAFRENIFLESVRDEKEMNSWNWFKETWLFSKAKFTELACFVP